MYDTWILWVFCWVFFGQYLFIFFRHVFFCVLEGKESYWLFCIVSPKNRHSHSAIHLCAPIQKDDWWKAQYLLLLTAVPELSIRLLFEWLKGFDRLWLQFGHPLIDLVQQLTSFHVDKKSCVAWTVELKHVSLHWFSTFWNRRLIFLYISMISYWGPERLLLHIRSYPRLNLQKMISKSTT